MIATEVAVSLWLKSERQRKVAGLKVNLRRGRSCANILVVCAPNRVSII